MPGITHALREERKRWREFLRSDHMSVGVYRLGPSDVDEQSPHGQDEIYYVVSGRALFRIGPDDVAVSPGQVLFVEAGAEHRFHHIEEELELLVVFAPPEAG